MVSVSRNLDDTSHRHLMFLMASIFAQLFKSESVLLTEYECINYELLVLLTEYECVNYEFNGMQWILEEIYSSADFMGIS